MRTLLRFVREILLKHWVLKLTSLLIAFGLWLMLRGSQGERVITVPLTVQIPRNMEIVSERPNMVEVTAQGYLANLTGSLPNMTYNIDLQSAGEGEQTIPLTPAGVRISPASSLRVSRVNPARITLILEKVISKDVPVKVPIRGTPAPGFDFYQVTCQPSIVSISGPRSDINPIKEVETDPVSIEARNASFHQTVNFRISDVDIHTSPVGPAEADIELGPHREVRTFSIPVGGFEGSAFVPNPPFVSVSVLIPAAIKERLAAEDLKATVTIPDPEPASNRIAVVPQVEFTKEPGAGITIRHVSPEQLTLVRKVRKK
jgi:YbbR domain-containing protein